MSDQPKHYIVSLKELPSPAHAAEHLQDTWDNRKPAIRPGMLAVYLGPRTHDAPHGTVHLARVKQTTGNAAEIEYHTSIGIATLPHVDLTMLMPLQTLLERLYEGLI